MNERRTLIEAQSPDQVLLAVVEADDRVVYLHLAGHAHSEFRTVSLWVRNLVPAPPGLDPDWQTAGRGPTLPFDACAHPVGLPAPDPERLSLVWFPGGDGVALLDGTEILAVIPPWAGIDDCPGYARDCTGQTPVAWNLGGPINNPVRDRVRDAMDFWRQWDDGSPWTELQRSLLQGMEAALGPHSAYYAIDGGRWPPRFIARFDRDDAVVLMTGGMSIRPQPQVERYYEEPQQVRRVELGVALSPDLAGGLDSLLRAISRLAAFPWSHTAWLGSGHTVPTRGVPAGASGRDFDALLVHAEPPGAPQIPLPPYRGEPVNVLWLLPITAAERELAMSEGSELLLERLDGGHWIHTDREVHA